MPGLGIFFPADTSLDKDSFLWPWDLWVLLGPSHVFLVFIDSFPQILHHKIDWKWSVLPHSKAAAEVTKQKTRCGAWKRRSTLGSLVWMFWWYFLYKILSLNWVHCKVPRWQLLAFPPTLSKNPKSLMAVPSILGWMLPEPWELAQEPLPQSFSWEGNRDSLFFYYWWFLFG
jgi:hypothetical protein